MRHEMPLALVLAFVPALVAACGTMAQEPGEEFLVASNAEAVPVPESSATESGHAAEGPHAVNLFVGGTVAGGKWNGLTIGADYEYRLSEVFGLGGFADAVVGGSHRSLALGPALYVHPIEPLALVVAPGWERKDGDWNAMLRLGGFYEFPFRERYAISPAFYWDLVDGESVFVLGASFGVKL